MIICIACQCDLVFIRKAESVVLWGRTRAAQPNRLDRCPSNITKLGLWRSSVAATRLRPPKDYTRELLSYRGPHSITPTKAQGYVTSHDPSRMLVRSRDRKGHLVMPNLYNTVVPRRYAHPKNHTCAVKVGVVVITRMLNRGQNV